MINTLFLHSEVPDPYTFYKTMLCENPVFWDKMNKSWAIYSYANCKAVLSDPAALVPSLSQGKKDGLNEYTLAISDRLARANNEYQHEVSRKTAMLLFENTQTVSLPEILNRLLQEKDDSAETDWVNKVCMRLPVTFILESFGFNTNGSDLISSHIGQLVKIMLPTRTLEEAFAINSVSKEVWTIIERHLLATKFYKTVATELAGRYGAGSDETLSLCISNLIGLLIQSYDAGRGILSNSLLQLLRREEISPGNLIDKEYLQKLVVESVRFDPPVHNTRRVAASAIILGHHEIQKGQMLLLVLAAANRDAVRFKQPDNFNIERINNNEHLTFGIGAHRCLAERFSVHMATNALLYLFKQYKTIRLVEKDIQYEPLINARLPKNILISCIK